MSALHRLVVSTAVALVATAGSPFAAGQNAGQNAGQAGAALARSLRCYSCHSATEQLIGPPYVAIASRYGQDRAAMVQVLARKIVLGGGGNWGVVPMVPNEHVKPAEALLLATWILDQAR
jgi:cytochrome c